MKKEVVVLLILVASMSLVSAIFTPTIPSDCSNSQISATWDSIFKESSSGITTASNTSESGKCNFFTAYKTTAGYSSILVGVDLSNFLLVNMTMILAMQGNFTSEFINLITNVSKSQASTSLSPSSNFSKYVTLRNSVSQSDADTEFKSVFYAPPSNWQTNTTTNGTFFTYFSNETIGNETKAIIGMVSANNNIDYLAFARMVLTGISSCTPHWTAHNTTCTNDRITEYFTDSNSCSQAIPANISSHCDSDGNGIIGNLAGIQSRTGLNISANFSAMNLSLNYSARGMQQVQFKSGSDVIVEFNWTFSSPLDLDNINIIRQSSGSYGYTLVRGIPVSKKILVSRIANSTIVCIRNQEVESINNITSDCSDSSEIELDCPAANSGISCSINGKFFLVSGLTNSAVREYTPVSNCIPYWANCTNWSSCSAGNQTRACTDIYRCNSSIILKVESRACNLTAPPICTPVWVCGNWTGCSQAGNQSRACTDRNSCSSSNHRTETQSCESGKKPGFSPALMISIAFISALIILVIVLIVYYINRKNPETQKEKTPATQYGFANPPSGYPPQQQL